MSAIGDCSKFPFVNTLFSKSTRGNEWNDMLPATSSRFVDRSRGLELKKEHKESVEIDFFFGFCDPPDKTIDTNHLC